MNPQTATKAIAASVTGIASSAAVFPALPPDTPWWAQILVVALPQIIAAVVYAVPNKPK